MQRFSGPYVNVNEEPLLQCDDEDDLADVDHDTNPDYISPINPLFPTGSASRKRIMSKHGKYITTRPTRHDGGWQWWVYFKKDWFHTICYTSWRKLAVYYVICYFSFWILFSMLYYPMTNWPKCREATNVYTWQDAMQLSVMVSSTIGFGYVHMSYACSWYPFAVLMVQVLVGRAFDAVVIGILIVKISRPQGRQHSIKFSPNAVVDTSLDGPPELQIRIAEIRRQQLAETHVRLILHEYGDGVGGPDGCFDVKSTPLLLEYAVEVEMYIFLAVPWVSRHIINSTSPLYKYVIEGCDGDYELVAVLEGIESTTGLTVQRMESYTPAEVLVGHRFASCCRKSLNKARSIEVDIGRLGSTVPC